MIHRVILKVVLATLFNFSFSYAQENEKKPAFYDYFVTLEINNSVTGYLDLLTRYHTDKILEWIRLGKMDTAVSDVKYTLESFPNHPKGLQMAGLVATLTKKPSLAIYYFERALKLYPQYAITHAQYGAYLISSGQIDAAITRLKQAVEIDPKSVGAYGLLAKAYSKNGNLELAQQAAEKARQLGYTGEVTP